MNRRAKHDASQMNGRTATITEINYGDAGSLYLNFQIDGDQQELYKSANSHTIVIFPDDPNYDSARSLREWQVVLLHSTTSRARPSGSFFQAGTYLTFEPTPK